jgi:hypothetical protein
MSRRAVGVDVDLELHSGADRRAPGAAVTVALCGHWEHDGACRWPHNSRIDDSRVPARLRTVAIVDEPSVAEVLRRMEDGLRAAPDWTVLAFHVGDIAEDERPLADRLLSAPRGRPGSG